jgi:hypothetical protein
MFFKKLNAYEITFIKIVIKIEKKSQKIKNRVLFFILKHTFGIIDITII